MVNDFGGVYLADDRSNKYIVKMFDTANARKHLFSL